MNLGPTFEHYYPEGSIGGQCGDFAHKLVQFPSVGNTLASKTVAVKKYGILTKDLHGDFREGDVVITSEAQDTGHVFVVNYAVKDYLQASESNFYLDKRVHHTRLIHKDSPKIVGVIRGPLKVKIMYPIKVLLVANNANWQSFPQKFDEIKTRVAQASGNQLDFQIDLMNTSFANVPVVPVGSGKIIAEAWFDQNVTPLGRGYDFVVFLLVIPDPNAMGFRGYTTDHDQGPIECQIYCVAENESIGGPNLPPMNMFVNIFIHEVAGHGLRQKTGQPDLRSDGTYLVHDYLFNQTPGGFNLQGLLSLLDYSKLSKTTMSNALFVHKAGTQEYGFYLPALSQDAIKDKALNLGVDILKADESVDFSKAKDVSGL